ncbi:TPA: ATP-grasp fold amidoligase family protein [Vibrio cholerae]|uniref:ATP-grasp fold amidoligase family protein n=1 Tax=Vibrio cholerae TaxID=666 RepID=UPI0030179AD3
MLNVANFFLVKIPIKIRLKFFYFFKFRKLLNLNNPKKYSEKVQARKLNMKEEFSTLSDKVLVKDYVKNKIGYEYIIKTLYVLDSLDDFNFDTLPSSFVIKTNFGSGKRHLEIVKDKTVADINRIKCKFAQAMQEPFYKGSLLGESQYDKINRKILIEEYMSDENQNGISDYKFHLFNYGEDGFLQVDFDRFVCHKRNLYDLNFDRLPYGLIYSGGTYQLPRKESLEEMLDIAKKLAKEFDYIRVDLYLINGKVYFGELTFTPENGFGTFTEPYADKYYGEIWK